MKVTGRARAKENVKVIGRETETSRAMETDVARAKENVKEIDRAQGIDGMRLMHGNKRTYLVASILYCLPQRRPILFWRN